MDVRTVKVRTKNDQGETVVRFVDAPLCQQCAGLGMIEQGGVYARCGHCGGKGELRAKDKALPQISGDYRAMV